MMMPYSQFAIYQPCTCWNVVKYKVTISIDGLASNYSIRLDIIEGERMRQVG